MMRTRGSVTADYQPPCAASVGLLMALKRVDPSRAGEPAHAHHHRHPMLTQEGCEEAQKCAFLTGIWEQF